MRGHAGTGPGLLRILLRMLSIVLAIAAPAAIAQDGAALDRAAAEEDGRQGLRLLEYEGVLGQPLGLDEALCIDAQLTRRWPAAAAPSRAQWERMQEQARQARERCATPPPGDPLAGDPERAAAVIRRAMALQIERQRALEALRTRLRACLAPADQPAAGGPAADKAAAAPDSAACRALQGTDTLSPGARARVQAAFEQGRR